MLKTFLYSKLHLEFTINKNHSASSCSQSFRNDNGVKKGGRHSITTQAPRRLPAPSPSATTHDLDDNVLCDRPRMIANTHSHVHCV